MENACLVQPQDRLAGRARARERERERERERGLYEFLEEALNDFSLF